MSEFLKIPAVMGARLARFLSSWVNLDVKDQLSVRRDTALFGHLFSLPAVAMASTALQTHDGVDLVHAVPSLALAFSLPMLAAGYLSFSGSKAARTVISALALPSFYLAATQAGTFFPEAAIFAGLMAGVAKRESLIEGRDLAIGAALTGLIALSGGLTVAATAALLGIAAYAVSASFKKVAEKRTSDASGQDISAIIPLIVGKSGFLLETDRSGLVFESHGNMGEFKGARLADAVHISDRVSLLTILDGLQAGLIDHAQLEVRLANPNTPVSARDYRRFPLQVAKYGDRILVSGQVPATESAEPSVEIAPIATVCHEMRTPLNAIIGFSEMLENGLAGALANERQTEYAGLINRSGQHLLDVVNAMLDLSAAENGIIPVKPATFLPDEVAMLSINMLAGQAKAKSIGLDYLPMSAFEPFVGDRRICQQILVNLLSNAVKFTGAGGSVRLTVDLTENRLEFEVTDSGVGMSKPELARAGTPYFRVVRPDQAPTNHGTGLGLALVRKMTEQHGGSMEIESTPGKGTRVRVVLVQMSQKDRPVTADSILLPPKDDESAKLIHLSEEPFDEAPRKTA